MSRLGIIIRREYLERVGKKSFVITTIAMPLLMIALMVMPALLVIWAGKGESEVVVLDRTGRIAGSLQDNDQVKFTISNEPLDSLVARGQGDAVLVIPATAIQAKKTELKLYTAGASSMGVEQAITSQVNDIIEDIRLDQRNLGDLKAILADVESNAEITCLRTDKDDARAADTQISYGVGIGMAFMLYMFLMIYGQMIMTSIIEEKNNRVLELVVSSVKASDLMMGKILGVTLVALTQMVIWGVILMALVLFAVPSFLTPAVVQGFDSPATIMMLLQPGHVATLITQLTLFLMVGFLFYAAIYAAIGSAVDNIQDASQLQVITMVPIILGLVLATVAAASPTSTLSLVTSLIPFTSPMVMVARLSFDIPSWQAWVSLAVLALSFYFMVKIAGKIYRVGIFMYGKKPTMGEIVKWMRYK